MFIITVLFVSKLNKVGAAMLTGTYGSKPILGNNIHTVFLFAEYYCSIKVVFEKK
jgi:hypothetical protein